MPSHISGPFKMFTTRQEVFLLIRFTKTGKIKTGEIWNAIFRLYCLKTLIDMINAKICFFNERERYNPQCLSRKKYWNFMNTNPISPTEMVIETVISSIGWRTCAPFCYHSQLLQVFLEHNKPL